MDYWLAQLVREPGMIRPQCAFLALALVTAAHADTLLILGAVPQEIVPIQEALKASSDQTEIEGIPCEHARLGAHELYVALTGVGKTNSAMVTAVLICHLHPKFALMTGTAARIRRSVRTGDIILATRITFHDMGSLTHDGIVTGKMDANGKLVDQLWWGPDRQHSTQYGYAPDPALLALASRLATSFVPERVATQGLDYVPVVRTGTVVTGDLSGVTDEKIADIRKRLDPDLMEMESASFAQVCSYLHTPFLVIRSGSNFAEEHNFDDYIRLSPIAARHAALFTLELVRSLP